MSVANREIAERLKAIREISEMSIEELAEKIGMQAGEYEKYESGNAEIPVSILYDVSGILKVSMTELLTGGSAKLHIYSLVRKDRGITVERNEAYKYQNLAYSFAGRKIEPLLVTVPVDEADAPYYLNKHPGHEYHYCLEGSFKIMIDKHELTINEGDSIYFDSHFPHGMKANGNKPAKILVIVI
ncbi:MAG: XRE family transcriptional regulator [Bacillota bacterium]|nr:XRE family transcriptional regulator [Bacillota bacterium]